MATKTKTASRITRMIDARTALRMVESKGSVTLLQADLESTTTFVAANHEAVNGKAVVRLTAESGATFDVPWDYKDEKTLTEVVPTPAWGDGITMSIGGDSYGGTIWSVSPSGKTFEFTLDETSRDEQGDLVHTPRDPWVRTTAYGTETNVKTARWSNKRGRFMVGQYVAVSVGTKRSHLDPHF